MPIDFIGIPSLVRKPIFSATAYRLRADHRPHGSWRPTAVSFRFALALNRTRGFVLADHPPGTVARISPHADQIHVRAQMLTSWRQDSRVLRMVIRIDNRESGMVHISLLCAAGDIDKIEVHGLPVW